MLKKKRIAFSFNGLLMLKLLSDVDCLKISDSPLKDLLLLKKKGIIIFRLKIE
ncbi:hypothetical protein [Arachidicoccus soli]|uniref:hypothetical protein n=1 Tax=Arachidicoccus soli TaxID=2341117 RepID=UPI0013C4D16E|nr:hypothetical protein [Arachidicoccus soli]